MLAGGLVILGFMYHYYAPYASCSLNIFFITWTLIMALVYAALSVRPELYSALAELPALSVRKAINCGCAICTQDRVLTGEMLFR